MNRFRQSRVALMLTMSSFRQSRVALILDVLLIVPGVLFWILKGGVPAVIKELMDYPAYFKRNWDTAGWFSGKKE